jgi:predicted nuclease of predicted toxin-antitoxin system
MRKILVDENLPRGLLVALGCPCVHATEIGGQVTDEKLWSHARDHGFVILTKDADFFNQLAACRT